MKNYTSKETAMQEYLSDFDIKNTPILNNEEQVKLIEQAKRGNKDAITKICKHNIRLIYKIALEYDKKQNKRIEMEDLMQAGYIGLLTAIQKYDSNRAKFSTYAHFWISQSIRRFYQNQKFVVNVPIYAQEILYNLNKATLNYFQQNNKYPSDIELFNFIKSNFNKYSFPKESSFTLEMVNKYRNLDLKYDVLSIETQKTQNNTDEDLNLLDILASDDIPIDEQIIIKTRREIILEYIDKCATSEKSAEMVKLYYGFIDDKMYTYKELGKKYGLSQEECRRMIGRVLRKMYVNDEFRKAMGINKPLVYTKQERKL